MGLMRLKRQGGKLTQSVSGKYWIVEWAIDGMIQGEMK